MNDSGNPAAGEAAKAYSSMMLSLLIAAHSLEDRIEKSLAAVGLSMAKLNVLSRMMEANRPLALSEIASRLNCVRSNVTQLIDRLESEGLVRREADPADRRSIRAVLTAEGERRQAVGAAELQRLSAEFIRVLPSAERDSLGRTLALLK